MASDNEASCESDPNFAVICAFMEKFGTTCGLQSIDFLELQEMLENTQEVPQELIDLHIKLLRKSRKTVSNERWEKAIIKFCHTFCVQDAWEIERFGYKKARLSSKLRVLKELLEMQFDYNARFKAEINKMSAEELRSQPLGKDKQGHAYWFQNDNNCQIRVYKEDPDEETWTLVAKDREGLAALITELSDGDSKISTESGINEEDSNSLVEKPIIDTGQVDSSSDSNKKLSGDSENSNESKESDKKEDISLEEEDEDSGENEPPTLKRQRESDEDSVEAKKLKMEEVSEEIEEPLMLVKGVGSGEDNECENPIVGEEIEEDLMFFYGAGDGAECETGNEDKTGDSQTNQSESGGSSSGARDSSDSALVSISDSKNCVNDEVPTSLVVKSPYKLGTIIDTKTDNKLHNPVKSPTKKSRWDVETIIAKEPPETGRVKQLVNKWEQIGEEKEEAPKKAMFFFGPGCLQFKPATVGFGQKVPPERDEGLEVTPDKAKGDVGYRIEEGDNKAETSECVQPEAGLLVNESDHQTPIESRIDKLDDVTRASDNVDAANLEQTKGDEATQDIQATLEAQVVEESEDVVVGDEPIPEVTAALVECDVKRQTKEETELVPEVEETCVKKHAYLLGGGDERVVENHQSVVDEDPEVNVSEDPKPTEEQDDKAASNFDENENKQLAADVKHEDCVEESSEDSIRKEEEESPEKIVQSENSEIGETDDFVADNKPETEVVKEENKEEDTPEDSIKVLEPVSDKETENLAQEASDPVLEKEETEDQLDEETLEEDEASDPVEKEEAENRLDEGTLKMDEASGSVEKEEIEDRLDKETLKVAGEASDPVEKEETEDRLDKETLKVADEASDPVLQKEENEDRSDPGCNLAKEASDPVLEQEETEDRLDKETSNLANEPSDPVLEKEETEERLDQTSIEANEEAVEVPKDASEVEETVEVSKEESEIEEAVDVSKGVSEEERSVQVPEGVSEEKETVEVSKELSDVEETVAVSKEGSEVEEAVEVSKEVSDVEEAAEVSKEVSDVEEAVEVSKEVSDVKEVVEVSKEVSDVEETVEVSKEVSDVEETVEASKEVSDVEETVEVSKEVSDLEETVEVSKEVPKVEEEVEISEEVSRVEENSQSELVASVEKEETQVSKEIEGPIEETSAKPEDNQQTTDDDVQVETKPEVVVKEDTKESHTIEEVPETDLEKETEVEDKKAPDKSETPKQEEIVAPAQETIVAPMLEAVVQLKEEDKVVIDDTLLKKEEEKQNPQNASTKRGRRNNSSDQATEDKKPRMFTRRTRSSKNEEGAEDIPLEVPPPTRRGRTRANQKAPKEETTDGDSTKKMKMSNEESQQEVEKKPEVKVEEPKELTVEKSEESKLVTEETSPASVQSANAAETVMVESSSSSDIVEVPDKDPLAVSEEETKEVKEKPPMSLATFSLDFTESPTPTPAPPVTRSGLRKRGRESPENYEETGETGSKRPKMRAKRAADVKLRKSIEEQKKKELISSDDDSKSEQTAKKKQTKKAEDTILVSSDAEKDVEATKKKNKKNKNRRLLTNLGIDPDRALDFEKEQNIGVRQSRRIAQLKIKEEAERRKLEEEMAHEAQKKKKKSKKHEDKDYKVEKKKIMEEDDEGEDEGTDTKKRKKKKKKHRKLFDEFNPWRSSSDSSSSNEEEEMGEEEEDDDEEVLQYVSDHEFSPESDMEGDGEALPLKRARTARKESDVEEVDDCPCQKCGKSDHPEWILLCDSCDNGWHCSCLRPPLLVIPEGDWFCPPCQHSSLLKQLQEKLQNYDKQLNKKEIEDRRKQRLAYVGISLNSVLPTKETENVKKRRHSDKEDEDDEDEDEEDEDEVVAGDESSSDESESGSASASESASDSDEPIYQLRQRRQAHSYRFNDYDELINSAIQEEMDAVKGAGNQGRGKDIATIVNAEKEEERKKETEAQEESAAYEPLPPVVPLKDKDKEAKPIFETDDDAIQVKKKIVGRKKHRKLNALDISSADDDEDSDEDFKGTSSESDDDFDEDLGSEDSEDLDSGRRRRGTDPVRRSTRARTSRYDADFIDDGESESEDEAPRRKKKRSIWDESESEESDRSWGRRKRKPASRSKKPTSTSKKKSKKKKKQHDSDEEVYKKKKPKIKFGLDGDDDGPVRRTRGKKINYVDALGSDSDDDRVKRPPPRIESDEEYVANEDDIGEDDKISEEEGEESVAKNQKIQIQSYTDARFTQLLPEPKSQLLGDEAEGELNPIDQINRNVEMMDENDMEKMMEEEEYANKQLQMVAQQLEKEKRRKEREAKKLEQSAPVQSKEAKRPRKQKDHFQFSGSMQEPLVGNVDSLIVNSENNDELSEPPGVSLPLFAELGTHADDDQAKKRRGKSKKSLEEAVANLGSARQVQEPVPPFMSLGNKALPTDLSLPQDSNIEIAAPPQPFSQSQPTPSVITRMLQSKPGQPGYPVGTIRPKQFATMPDREEDVHHSPVHHGQYMQGAPGLRPQLSSPYRQMAPSMNHYPRAGPPPPIRNPVPHMYHSHRPMDPSPSGGGLADHHNSPGRVVSPASSSPGSNKNETPPPPYSRPAAPPPPPGGGGGRFPLIGASPAARHLQMVPPPPSHLQPPRPSLSPYHPGMPPQYHYGQFGPEDALPPTVYQNSPYSEQFAAEVGQENSNSKSFEEESGGEFGGLVSYFSSQREDDLES